MYYAERRPDGTGYVQYYSFHMTLLEKVDPQAQEKAQPLPDARVGDLPGVMGMSNILMVVALLLVHLSNTSSHVCKEVNEFRGMEMIPC